MSTAEVPSDLFISYSRADRGWVEGYLLDALTAANVRVISELNFALGAPRIAEFERAIKQSKRTLLVISPAYVAESGLQFVDIMVQSYGLESGTWPVIPLVLQAVELPPRLAFLVSLDATEVESWPDVVARLCQAVQSGPPTPSARPPCPYPGMRAFRQEEATHFYGREAEVDDLLQRLRRHPFTAVIGASGSGKSSLVFAGLIPALRRSGLFGEGEWLVRSLRPGDHPLAALQSSLGVADAGQFIPTTLLATEKASQLLLVVDQFEEVFTQGAAERDAFFAAIQRLTSLRDCFVVITVRADFFDDLLTSALWPLIQPHRLEIAPLGAAGLRAAIVKPAEDVGVFIESALVERLVAGSVGQPGLLPFVQEVMVRLWEKLERRYLPLRAYEALVLPLAGYSDNERESIIRAIALLADEIIHRLGPAQQSIARRILLRLVQFGEGRDDTRRQQPVSALHAAGDDAALFDSTLNYLAENRLLVLSGAQGSEPRVDLAHEAMLTGWPMLRDWVKEGKEAEGVRRRLEDRAAEWVRLGRKGGLLDETEYRAADEWLQRESASVVGVSDTLYAFIATSRKTVQRQRILRRTKHVVVSGLLLFLLVAVANYLFAWWVNSSWALVTGAPKGRLSAITSQNNRTVIGSLEYGIAWDNNEDNWVDWVAEGLPIGRKAEDLKDPTANRNVIHFVAVDPVHPEHLYAVMEKYGIFDLRIQNPIWQKNSENIPALSDARTPLAVFDETLLLIADQPGIFVWQDNKSRWQRLVDPPLDQDLTVVLFSEDGIPFVAGERGILRGDGSFPWQWSAFGDVEKVKWLAIGDHGTLFYVTQREGREIAGCLTKDGEKLGKSVEIPNTNWLLSLAVLPEVESIVAHPLNPEEFFLSTTDGAVYQVNCQGNWRTLARKSFLISRNVLSVRQTPKNDYELLWASSAGLLARPLVGTE